MPTQTSPNPFPHLLLAHLHPLVQNHKHSDNLAVPVIRDATSRGVQDGVVAEEAVFNIEGVDVFAAADDEVFEAPGDFDVALVVHFCFVAGLWRGVGGVLGAFLWVVGDGGVVFRGLGRETHMHPFRSVGVLDHYFVCAGLVFPVAFHD